MCKNDGRETVVNFIAHNVGHLAMCRNGNKYYKPAQCGISQMPLLGAVLPSYEYFKKIVTANISAVYYYWGFSNTVRSRIISNTMGINWQKFPVKPINNIYPLW